MKKFLFEDISPFIRNAKRYVVTRESKETVACYDNLLIYVIKNAISLKLDDNIHTLERGEVVIIKAGVYYSMQAVEDDASIIMIDFDFSSSYKNINFRNLYDIRENFNSEKIIERLTFINFPPFNTTIHVKGLQIIEHRLIEIVQEFTNRGTYSAMKVSSILQTFLVDVARMLKSNAFERENGGIIVDDVLKYIDEHATENLTNETIGKIFAMHPNHVNTIVKKTTGYTLHNYVLTRRLASAIDMLDNTAIPVYEISDKCGFSESKNFIRYFKNAVGITPQQYRNRKE